MIIDKKIKIKAGNGIISHLRKLGYYPAHNEEILIDVDQLMCGSKYKIKVSCDICKKLKDIPYCNYLQSIKNNNIYTCNKCSHFKIKITCLEKYGCENPSQIDGHKEKIHIKWSQKTKEEIAEIQRKTKETNFKQYGNEFYRNLEKAKQTNIEKYGCENPFQNEEIKEEIKNINLEKYGFEYPLQSEFIQNKQKQTNIKKYGCEYIMQSDIFIDKRIETYIKNYGVNSPIKNIEIKKKIKKTCLEKYGCENYTQTKEYTEKSKQTKIENGNQISDELRCKFDLYKKEIVNLTNKNREKLFKNWDGIDFYDKEYIKDKHKIFMNMKELHGK